MGRKMKVIRLNGIVINIGDWDYGLVEVDHGLTDITNPLPEGAVESDEEVVTGWDGGLYLHDDPRRLGQA
jgi:hypothetical protein